MGITGITEWISPHKAYFYGHHNLTCFGCKVLYIIIHQSITRKTGGALAKLFWLVLYRQELPSSFPIRFVTGTYLRIACDFNCNIL